MNPLEDTLNIGPTMPRQGTSGGTTPPGDLLSDLDAQHTVRMPGAGTLVFGRYRLQRVLGRGGMGVVWLAVDTKLERAVALKFLPDAVGIDPVALKELKEETRRGLDLAHPNIVRIYDFVDDDEGSAAISMEFVDGKSLSERRITQPHHVFTVDQVGPWVGQLCDALDYAHQQKRIVHRDLKPANLMVNSESQLKITDFGISCSLSDTMSRLSRTQQNAGTSGTLLYMSPQQAMGDRPRPTDDIYAVGATLYELLTGKPPFYRGDITTQITSKTAPKLRERREELEIAATDDIPKHWEDAIAACLDKDPARRPQTAGELAQMLGVSLRGETSRAPAPATASVQTNSGGLRPVEISSSATSRSTTAPAVPAAKEPTSPLVKLILGGTVLVLLLAALIAGGLWWWSNRPGEWNVQTSPPGATVTIGTQSVKAPAVMGELKPGDYQAVIQLAGYEDRTVAFKVAPGQKVDIGSVTLEPSRGSLTITSEPAEVSFEVKSSSHPELPKVEGETPRTLRLPIGDYEITLKHETGRKIDQVTVARNSDSQRHFKFEKPVPPPPPPVPDPVVVKTEPPAAPPAMPSSADDPPPAPSPAPAPAPLPPVAAAPTPAPAPSPTATAPPGPASIGGALAGSPSAPPAAPTAPGAPPTADTPPGGDASTPPGPGAGGVSGIGGGVNMALSNLQPSVGEPPKGFWELDDIFSSSPYQSFSENGQRNVLYQAQRKLKISSDGKVGKSTHSAITKFQGTNNLQPTGQLDSATLAALGLDSVTDNPKWSPPVVTSTRRSTPSSSRTPDSEKTWLRRTIERNILGGRDLKDAVRGKKR